MISRVIEYEWQRKSMIDLIGARKLPFTVTIADGRNRSIEQNNLMWKWNTEISQQLGDRTPSEVHAYCKAYFGVPILRETNEAFREQYDKIVRPLSYEDKLAIMGPPIDLPITSVFGVRQMTRYLDAVQKHFAEQGCVLTQPSDG